MSGGFKTAEAGREPEIMECVRKVSYVIPPTSKKETIYQHVLCPEVVSETPITEITSTRPSMPGASPAHRIDTGSPIVHTIVIGSEMVVGTLRMSCY
jgi:hypothetical protein